MYGCEDRTLLGDVGVVLCDEARQEEGNSGELMGVSEDCRDEDQVLLGDGGGHVDAELLADADEVSLLSAVGVDGVVGVLEAGVEGGDGLTSPLPI